MAILYTPQLKTSMNDGFSTTLKESYSYFLNKENINILGEGFKEVLRNDNLFDTYISKLVENVSNATEESQLTTLMTNCRETILTESSVAGIPNVASLAMPTIRKMWAKIALKYAIPTEAVKTPAFQVSYSRPFIYDKDTNEKRYLPEALRDNDNDIAEKTRLSDQMYTLPLTQKDILADTGSGNSLSVGDAIDRNFRLAKVKIKCKDATKTDANTETKEVIIKASAGKIDLNNRIFVEVVGKHTDGTITTDNVFVSVDMFKGTITATSVTGAVTEVSFFGFVSSESHNNATNVGFELERRDFTIPTGEHIEASLPLEFLNDVKAMYDIDGTAEIVDTLSNVTSQKVDQEIYNFIQNTFDEDPQYIKEFDVHPQGLFAGNPKDWLPELRRVINWLANTIKSKTLYYTGYWVIIGNPVDVGIIPDVTWSFNKVTNDNNGIDVEYSIGAMSGDNKYTIIKSDLIPQGDLTMFFVPNENKYLTIKYFPYTFNIVNNYLNTRQPNIPSIMMTKRHTMEAFMPIIAKIKILNNDGTLVSKI